MALIGMLAHPTRYKPRPGKSANWHEAIAEEAYEIADAMAAEDKKG
jgi:NTP pyrophosphatase (non-canonical NTP hydrolase)